VLKNPTVGECENAVEASPPPARWPNAASELPLFLTPKELAGLLNTSVRTLQRDRLKEKPLPYTKRGRVVLYPRDPVLAALSCGPGV
jgi:hypothetical protein